MFASENGGRGGVSKLLILLTDGTQTKAHDAEDPALIAEELRNMGMTFIVVGMGAGINPTELVRIAGGHDKSFTADSFTDLLDAKFIKNVQSKACAGK